MDTHSNITHTWSVTNLCSYAYISVIVYKLLLARLHTCIELNLLPYKVIEKTFVLVWLYSRLHYTINS